MIGALALGREEPAASGGVRRPAQGRSCSTRLLLVIPALRSLRSKTVSSRRRDVQEHGGRVTEKRGGIATIAKTRRARKVGGRGRGSGRGSGTGMQVNVKTLITGTKRSTDTGEATAHKQSLLKMASCNKAGHRRHCLPFLPAPWYLSPDLLSCPSLTPPYRGVAATSMVSTDCFYISVTGAIQ